jgi:hypothetical protein
MLQPMDQGVIRSLKCHYRKLILLRMMQCIEKKQDHAVTLLDTIRCIEKAWRQVTDRTIHNCSGHAGILSAQGVNVTEKMTSKLKLPLQLLLMLLMMMMICHYPSGCEKLIVMCWDTMIMTSMQHRSLS